MRFSIALSFAGENREYVSKVADILSEHCGEEKILYDKYYEAEFSRPNLGIYLPKLYNDESKLIVVFICKNYEKKDWCGLEWRAIFDLIMQRSDDIMLVRFDKVLIPGLYNFDGFLDIEKRVPEEIAEQILKRLDSNYILQKKPTAQVKEKDTVQLILPGDINDFSAERKERFLKCLALLLEDGDVRITSVQPHNSILITLSIKKGAANKLIGFVDKQPLKEFKILEIIVNNATVFHRPIPQTKFSRPVSLKKPLIIKTESVKKLRRFTTTILGSLINDLNTVEEYGFDNNTADMVNSVLRNIETRVQQISGSSWMQNIVLDFGDFRQAFKRWDSRGGTTMSAVSERRMEIEKLKSYRERWKSHVNKSIKRDDADDKEVGDFIDYAVSELNTLCNMKPAIFRNLTGSLNAYYLRIGKVRVQKSSF